MSEKERYNFNRIIQLGEQLAKYLNDNDITADKISEDFSVQWTVTTPLYNIGERVYKIPNEIKEEYPEIPWAKISGLRHRLVHDYEGIKWDIVIEIIFNDLPMFIKNLKKINID
ncbi:MAG: HepT-like ribonuclease domain-containing protein [Anaerovoracaceae bacterium]